MRLFRNAGRMTQRVRLMDSSSSDASTAGIFP